MQKATFFDSSTQSQCSYILRELRDNQRALTVRIMYEELGIASPPRRICDLIQNGHEIGKAWTHEESPTGVNRQVRLYYWPNKKRSST